MSFCYRACGMRNGTWVAQHTKKDPEEGTDGRSMPCLAHGNPNPKWARFHDVSSSSKRIHKGESESSWIIYLGVGVTKKLGVVDLQGKPWNVLVYFFKTFLLDTPVSDVQFLDVRLGNTIPVQVLCVHGISLWIHVVRAVKWAPVKHVLTNTEFDQLG